MAKPLQDEGQGQARDREAEMKMTGMTRKQKFLRLIVILFTVVIVLPMPCHAFDRLNICGKRSCVIGDDPPRPPRERIERPSGGGGSSGGGSGRQSYPNVHRTFWGKLEPDDGYEWASKGPNDYSVRPIPEGRLHKKYPNVVWTGDGKTFRPAPGYDWVNNDPNDFRVRLAPGLTASADGRFHPALGYTWVNDNDPKDLRVQRVPGTPTDYSNVVWAANGMWRPAPGYTWISDDPSGKRDFRVKPLAAGTHHEEYPNVVWSGDGTRFHPAPGYGWVSDDPSGKQDFRVKPLPAGTPHPDHPNVVWSGDGHSFKPADGYRWANPGNPKDLRVEPDPVAEYQRKETRAVASARENVDTLIADIGRQSGGSGLGKPQSIHRVINGEVVEFTIQAHPKDGPMAAEEQLRATEAAGQGAAGAAKPQIASDQSQLGFDTPAGRPQGSRALPVPVTGSQGPPQPLVPDRYKRDSEIKKLLVEKEKADQKYAELAKQLKAINDKIANQEGDTGELQVAATKVMDQMTAAKSTSDTVTVKVQNRVRMLQFSGVDLTEEPVDKKGAEGNPGTGAPPGSEKSLN